MDVETLKNAGKALFVGWMAWELLGPDNTARRAEAKAWDRDEWLVELEGRQAHLPCPCPPGWTTWPLDATRSTFSVIGWVVATSTIKPCPLEDNYDRHFLFFSHPFDPPFAKFRATMQGGVICTYSDEKWVNEVKSLFPNFQARQFHSSSKEAGFDKKWELIEEASKRRRKVKIEGVVETAPQEYGDVLYYGFQGFDRGAFDCPVVSRLRVEFLG